jgi:putative ABC transport system ATP-binding protein
LLFFTSAKTGASGLPGEPHMMDTMIHLTNVSKTFETAAGSFQALTDIDLSIGRGEFVAIIGKSGSGKSTLINMMTGIDRPTSGEVLINGTAIQTLTESRLAAWRGRNIGVVFQFFQLIPTLSVLNNVLLPMDFCGSCSRAECRDRALHLLELVGLGEHVHKLPTALSGGQQQRAAIARALANDPPLLVGDEPTGNLDSGTASQIFELFDQLILEGKTLVMVTHDSDLATRVHRSITVHDGRIADPHTAGKTAHA